MENRKKFETIRPLIDNAFNSGCDFRFKPNGISMLPFIRGGVDTVTIEKYKGGAQKYDIVFYRRDDGKYVMHRIVKIFGDCYGVCGDNQWWIEKVPEENIFAIVTAVEGKKGNGSFLYLNTLFIRRFIKHVINYIKRYTGGERK